MLNSETALYPLAVERTAPAQRVSLPVASTAVQVGAVASLTLLALFLRYLFAVRSGMWRDEALFLFIVHKPTWGAMLDFLMHHESHPPVFYTLMRLWQSVWGFSEGSALALVVLLGAVQIPVVYVVGRRIFSPVAAMTAAFLATLSASLAENAGLVRPYSLLPLLCLLSVYLLWESMSEPRKSYRRWFRFFYILATATMLYTHNWAWLVLGAEWTVIGACLLFGFTGGNSKWRLLWEGIAAQVGVLLLYAPWVPIFRYQAQHAGHGTAAVPKLLHTVSQFATIMLPLPDDDSGFFLLALLLAAVGGIVYGYRKRRGAFPALPSASAPPRPAAIRESRVMLGIILLTGVPIIAFTAAMVLNTLSLLLLPRCMAMLAPCALLVIAHAIVTLPLRPFLRFAAVAGLGIGCLYTTLLVLSIPKSNARELAAFITSQVRKNDLIIITPEHLASSFNYYYKLPTEQIDFPGNGREEATKFDDWVARCADRGRLDRTFARIDLARRQKRRVWLILADGLFFAHTPNNDRLLSKHMLTTIVVGVVRSSQIRQRLVLRYRGAAGAYLPGNRHDSDEVLTALLFDPNAALLVPHDGAAAPQPVQ